MLTKFFGKVPRSSQDTLPYEGVFTNGVIEVTPGKFSKSYPLADANFKIASPEEQANIFLKYQDMLNVFGSGVHFEITVYHKTVDSDKVKKEVLIPLKGDSYDEYREEMNEILLNKMNSGSGNLALETYLTITVDAEGIDEANKTFTRLDAQLAPTVKSLNGEDITPFTLEERMYTLYEIFNMNTPTSFNKKREINGKVISGFDLNNLKTMGITTKDIIAPACITVNNDHMILDDKYVRVMFLSKIDSFLSTEFFSELTSISCNMLTSVHFDALATDKAIKLIRNQLTSIDGEVAKKQKKLSQDGISPDLLPPMLMKQREEAKKYMEDITSRNQKLFLTTLVVAIFGDSLEEVKNYEEMVHAVATKYMCDFKKLFSQQEVGLASALPLGINKVLSDRLLTSETAALFIPFSSQEISHKRGFYYGINPLSRNLILFDRTSAKNANGVILGMSGTGKSFGCKREMLNVLLNTDDVVYVIDPDREYVPLAERLGGEVVKLAMGSDNHLNPLDMDIKYADDDNPISQKSDFLSSLCEIVAGSKFGLTPIQKTIIDRCTIQVYEQYLKYLESRDGVNFDADRCPTLIDFYKCLETQPELEAHTLALSLERFATGNYDMFAHKTNVNVKKRFVVYDIKDIGSQLKELGLQVCLNDIWNRMIANKRIGKRTWFYIDEFSLLTRTEYSIAFLQTVFKRARKFGGVPTGITQNIEDMLLNPESRSIIENCDFVMMYGQSPIDRVALGNMYGISDAQMKYITNPDKGCGLLYTGKTIIPFEDKYPKDTKTYEMMSTSFEDKTAFSQT